MNNSKRFSHYSYYSKKDVVDNYDEDRYGSSFGRYLYDLEINTFLNLISNNGKILDVGTGTGKLLLAIIKMGGDVTGVDSSVSMIFFLKNKYDDNVLNGRLQVADAISLPFADKSFDSVISSRVLMHLFDWRQGIKEFCRVSRKEVIIDFPPLSGFTFFIPFLNKFRKLFSKDFRPYKIFSLKSVKHEFERYNYKVVESKRLFFLPVATHRYIDNVNFSKQIENLFERIGLTKIFGGPVLIKALRHDV